MTPETRYHVERREHGQTAWTLDSCTSTPEDARAQLDNLRGAFDDVCEFRAVRVHREVQDW